jgi:hypothetical protein
MFEEAKDEKVAYKQYLKILGTRTVDDPKIVNSFVRGFKQAYDNGRYHIKRLKGTELGKEIYLEFESAIHYLNEAYTVQKNQSSQYHARIEEAQYYGQSLGSFLSAVEYGIVSKNFYNANISYSG